VSFVVGVSECVCVCVYVCVCHMTTFILYIYIYINMLCTIIIHAHMLYHMLFVPGVCVVSNRE